MVKYQYLFGPVPSRRLGISLGVDLIPFKTCTLNCVYCECGETNNLTIERKDYVPVPEVTGELDNYLKDSPDLDYITFSGSGEPTLHFHIDKIIDHLKQNYPQYKIALLTNGTLFYQEELREKVKRADLILPSLDTAKEATFKKLNRPHGSLNFQRVLSGLIQLRRGYKGKIFLEVFLVPGLNDTKDELALLEGAIKKISPDKVQLNTLDRPGTENWVRAAREEELEAISSYLGEAEIIKQFLPRKGTPTGQKEIEETILSTLKRRPCTAEDLSHLLGLHLSEVNNYLHKLLEKDKIKTEEKQRGVFFKIAF